MKNLSKILKKNLNEDGKLNCKDAYDIAHQYNVSIGTIGDCAKEYHICIDSCELGQFGNLDCNDYNSSSKKLLEEFITNNQIKCACARSAAAGIGLKYIRNYIKSEKIKVTNCELGFDLK